MDTNKKLSDNFFLWEFVNSQTAKRYGIDNTPSEQDIENLTYLCKTTLQPARDKFGPIFISSGYRSNALNKRIGGAVGSQHQVGMAADIEVADEYTSNFKLAQWIRDNCEFDQLILEYPDDTTKGGWVHVSCKEVGNRKQVLTITREGNIIVTKTGLHWSGFSS